MIYVLELGTVGFVGGGYSYYVHILVSRIVFFYYWFTSYRCMLVMTLLLHMLYVI